MTTSRYRTYMQSKAWKRKKAKYWKSKYKKCCYLCSKPKHRGMHLHHITYERLGRERLSDLVPVCAECHKIIHDFAKNNPRLSIKEATKECKKTFK